MATDPVYTCPMHPEVVARGPGSCPICGMALEPRNPTIDEGENADLVEMLRRFWVSLVFTTPLLVLSMGGLIPGISFQRLASPGGLALIEFALATPVVLWGGVAVLRARLAIVGDTGTSTCSR